MHVMITSRCNMRCAHCGMSCTAKGEDMTLKTFMAALQHDDTISLGGGEATARARWLGHLDAGVRTETPASVRSSTARELADDPLLASVIHRAADADSDVHFEPGLSGGTW